VSLFVVTGEKLFFTASGILVICFCLGCFVKIIIWLFKRKRPTEEYYSITHIGAGDYPKCDTCQEYDTNLCNSYPSKVDFNPDGSPLNLQFCKKEGRTFKF
jgi:hypothetical protein